MKNRSKILTTVFMCTALALSCLSFAIGTQRAAAVSETEPGTAMLIGCLGDKNDPAHNYQQWGTGESQVLSGSKAANITADGDYQVSFSIAGDPKGQVTKISYLCLQIAGVTKSNNPNLAVTVKDISIDGTPVPAYVTNPASIDYEYYANGNGYTRVYFCVEDGWGITPVSDVDSAKTVSDNITVDFNITGVSGSAFATGNGAGAATNVPSDVTSMEDMTTDTTVATAALSSTDAPVGNSTTGDAGVAGAVAGGVIAVLLAVLSFRKRR